MPIKRMDITGFKSFMARSVFAFDAGVPGWVGPPGQGGGVSRVRGARGPPMQDVGGLEPLGGGAAREAGVPPVEQPEQVAKSGGDEPVCAALIMPQQVIGGDRADLRQWRAPGGLGRRGGPFPRGFRGLCSLTRCAPFRLRVGGVGGALGRAEQRAHLRRWTTNRRALRARRRT